VLIRVHAASVNPVDWKRRRAMPADQLPAVLGRDVSGTIEVSPGSGLRRGRRGLRLRGDRRLRGAHRLARERDRPQARCDHPRASRGDSGRRADGVAGAVRWRRPRRRPGGADLGRRRRRRPFRGAVREARRRPHDRHRVHRQPRLRPRPRRGPVRRLHPGARRRRGERRGRSPRHRGRGDAAVAARRRARWGHPARNRGRPARGGGSRSGVRTSPSRRNANPDQLARIADLVSSGEVRVEIAEVLPLTEVARAHELSEAGHVRGKLVLAVAD